MKPKREGKAKAKRKKRKKRREKKRLKKEEKFKKEGEREWVSFLLSVLTPELFNSQKHSSKTFPEVPLRNTGRRNWEWSQVLHKHLDR